MPGHPRPQATGVTPASPTTRSKTVVFPSSVIDGVYVVTPAVHGDERGTFVETYRRDWFPASPEMLQANRAQRTAGSIVGLHYHLHQTDYWYVVAGHARAVLHDLRASSPTDGATLTLEMGPIDAIGDHVGLLIPPGVAHGFAAVTDVVLTYLVDRYYDPSDELGVAWDDPTVGASWGIDAPLLSERDRSNPPRHGV